MFGPAERWVEQMVIAERKPLTEILEMVRPYRSLLIVGCSGCMTVNLSGGAREVGLMAQEVKLAFQANRRDIEVADHLVQRQCEPVFIEDVDEEVGKAEAVLSLGCGAGVQSLAERYPFVPVFPAVNTRFIGISEGQGVWVERCQACGECILDRTAGICPVSRCPKHLLNGPCGGSQDGLCEIGGEVPCAWVLIYKLMERRGEINRLLSIQQAKNWSKGNGPGKVLKGGRLRENRE